MQRTEVDDIKSLGTVMGIWAHPDDETFCSGGVMAAAAQNGQKVIIVTATRGEKGVQDESRWPAAELAAIRTKELKKALEILNATKHYQLDYKDGGCASADQPEAVSELAKLIKKYRPDTILTFGPDGLTGHPDHQTISNWAMAARLMAGSEARLLYSVQTTEQYARSQVLDSALNFFYNTPKPPTYDESETALCLHLDDKLCQQKMSALKVMPSQYQIMFEKFGEPEIKSCFDVEAFVDALG